ncbi:unnamed protein product [Rotaria sordida]|uniref:Uncharacterized protein n=1 Tax=Rotaria sordida TaxID=392033 RepID=A0A815D2Y3_9BILA|nr:unnamed protein product [Rotaria sordida]
MRHVQYYKVRIKQFLIDYFNIKIRLRKRTRQLFYLKPRQQQSSISFPISLVLAQIKYDLSMGLASNDRAETILQDLIEGYVDNSKYNSMLEKCLNLINIDHKHKTIRKPY